MRLTYVFAAALLLGALAPAVRAEDEERDASTLERLAVHDLLALAGAYDTEAKAAYEALKAMGPARVMPHVVLAELPGPAQDAALRFAVEFADPPDLFRVFRQAMADDDEDLQLIAIQGLEDATNGHVRDLDFEPAWWRDLLLAFHGTEVVEIEGFYSGPGYPSWNLASLLTNHVHGSEATLLGLTRDDNRRVRMMAIGFLALTARERTPEVEEALRAAFADPDPSVRRQAVLSAGAGEWTALAPDVAARLVDEEQDPALRCDAASVAASLDPAGAAPFLLRALADPTPAVRAAAASAADMVEGDERIAVALLDALDDPDPAVRHEAARSSWIALDVPALGNAPGISWEGIETSLDDPDPQVRVAAARVLTAHGRVRAALLPSLVPMLQAGEREYPNEIAWAARALGTLRGEGRAALPALEAVPPGRWMEAAEEAIDAITMATLSVADVGAELAADDAEVRLRAVGEAARREENDLLATALRDPDPRVALRAAEALVEDERHTAGVVHAALAAEHARVFARPGRLLEQLGDRVLPHATELLGDYARRPRSRVFWLLARVNGLRPALARVQWAHLEANTGDGDAVNQAAWLGPEMLPYLAPALGADHPLELRLALTVIEEMSEEDRVAFHPALRKLRGELDPTSLWHDRLDALLEPPPLGPHYGDFPIR